MAAIRLDYYKSGEKSYVRHHVDIYMDGEIFAYYEATKKTDLSTVIYDFYKARGVVIKPVFDGVDFPDFKATENQLRELTGQLSEFRIWKKLK